MSKHFRDIMNLNVITLALVLLPTAMAIGGLCLSLDDYGAIPTFQPSRWVNNFHWATVIGFAILSLLGMLASIAAVLDLRSHLRRRGMY